MSEDLANTGKILIYQNEKGDTKIDVYFEEDTIWMTQRSMAELYQVDVRTINEHIGNILNDGELDEIATIRNFRIVRQEGLRQIQRELKHYNLDMILAVGYRVRSGVGIHFRRWASGVLTEYMKKGFALNDERLREPREFGADYFDELLERIRDIRASEKRVYQKVKEIFALSVDYDSKSPIAQNFFKSVQNKPGEFLRFNGREVLENFGTVKREVAEKLALEQYEQYDTHRRALEAADNVDGLTADVKRLKP